MNFFQTVAQLERFTEFAPKEFYSDGDRVFALGNLSITLVSNGRQLSSEWVHVITFRNGKVARSGSSSTRPLTSRHIAVRELRPAALIARDAAVMGKAAKFPQVPQGTLQTVP